MESRDKERVDQWLDGALKQYGEAEPRAGLEARVLANLRAAEETKAQGWLWWTAVAAVVLVAGATIFVMQTRRESSSIASSTRAVPTTGLQSLSVSAATKTPARPTPAQRRHHSRAVQLAEAIPHLDQFPSPQPLSAQDKLLLRYLRNASKVGVLQESAEGSFGGQKRGDKAALLTHEISLPSPPINFNLKQVATVTLDALPTVPMQTN